MAIHSGSSFGGEAPHELVRADDLTQLPDIEQAWYSQALKVLVVGLGTQRYEVVSGVENEDIARIVTASREADIMRNRSSQVPCPVAGDLLTSLAFKTLVDPVGAESSADIRVFVDIPSASEGQSIHT